MEEKGQEESALQKEIDSIKEVGIGYRCSLEEEFEQVRFFRFRRENKEPSGRIKTTLIERVLHDKGELIALLEQENRELSQQK